MLRVHGIHPHCTPLVALFYTRFMALCVLYRALNKVMLVRCFRLICDNYSDSMKLVAACISRVNRQIRGLHPLQL
jgi:hypothetical protein